jgi:hypothetical protein
LELVDAIVIAGVLDAIVIVGLGDEPGEDETTSVMFCTDVALLAYG